MLKSSRFHSSLISDTLMLVPNFLLQPVAALMIWQGQLSPYWRLPADIGASKTACTGLWMLPFEEITAGSARTMVPRTWQSWAK